MSIIVFTLSAGRALHKFKVYKKQFIMSGNRDACQKKMSIFMCLVMSFGTISVAGISKSNGVQMVLPEYLITKTGKAKYSGIFPSFKIMINGMDYNSEVFSLKKKYPALLYDNLIYLPLTNEIVDALKLKLQFSMEKGFSIDTLNPTVKNIDTVSQDIEYSKSRELTVVKKGLIYYITSDNLVAVFC